MNSSSDRFNHVVPIGPARRARLATFCRALHWIAFAGVGSVGIADAAEHDMAGFVQGGVGDRPVWSADIGLIRDFRSKDSETDSRWRFFGEIDLGEWRTRATDGQPGKRYTHVGVTPTFRYAFGLDRSLFVELGVGFNTVTPKYHIKSKHFSTLFNFGDHVAIGKRFGDNLENEIALRIEHFSNAGIGDPNPGQNFGQLRYARHF
jgi:lipid A 3-O-deacylase